MRRGACVVFIALALGLASPAVSASRRTARLEHSRSAGAEACPDEQALRAAVAARLGYDPFTPDASMLIAVAVDSSADGLRATVRLVTEAGRTAERSIVSRSTDCRELAESTALAIALAIDPQMSLRARREPATAQAPIPPPAPPPPEAPASAPLRLRLEADLLLALGAAPDLSFGGALRGALRFTSIAVTLEARADVPASTPFERGRVGSSLLALAAGGCYCWRYVHACALVSGGAVRAFGEGFPEASVRWQPYLAAGPRALVQVPLGGPLYLQAHADVLFPFLRSALLIGTIEAWRMPPVSGALGVGLGFQLE